MRKGLQNPNSIAAIEELRMEIAQELGIHNIKEVENDRNDTRNEMINRKLADRARLNLIGFK